MKSVRKDRLLAAVAMGVALVAPAFVGPYGHYVLAIILIYGLVALSLNIVTGVGGQISIGHAGFWAIGAYTCAILVTKVGLPFLLCVALGGAVAAVFGLIVALPALRVQGHYLAIATLGLALVVQQVLYEWTSLTGGRGGMFVPRPQILGYEFLDDGPYYYVILAITVFFTWVTVNYRKSLTGLGLGALRMSAIAAQCSGVGRTYHIITAFVLSAFMTGVSGALYGHLIGQLSTDSFTLTVSLSFLTMVVVGGLNSVAGALLGGVFLAYAPELMRELKDAQMIVYGGTLVLFMHFLPGGLASIPERILDLARARR
ncbi:MAG TPA: branched-chain amino acid ABC transporter permease [Hyphomicrobiaceae bacterium]